jgi:hypothetical protein
LFVTIVAVQQPGYFVASDADVVWDCDNEWHSFVDRWSCL